MCVIFQYMRFRVGGSYFRTYNLGGGGAVCTYWHYFVNLARVILSLRLSGNVQISQACKSCAFGSLCVAP